ncbi:hypothetical protein, partial [Catenulispora rubra]|uniref:hypothetical protein n=1 Tax=Catenulispora rubra TaxID=280293 RepID=UPI001E345F09
REAAGIGAQAPVERQPDVQNSVAGPRESAARGQVVAEKQEPMAAREVAASVGAQAPAERQAGQADGQGLVVGARESVAGAQAAAEQQAVRVGAVADARPASEPVVARGPASADSAPGQPDAVKPSVAGSWRTQGSVAGSRWSAVKGSQVRPSASPTVSGGKDAVSNLASAANQQGTAADKQGAVTAQQGTVVGQQSEPVTPQSAAPNPKPRTPAKSPEALRPTHRRTGAFGLRWGRSRSQRPVVPPSPEPVAAVVAPVLSAAETAASAPAQPQPAVPFTVASPASHHPDPDSGGMTPWRAAAARAAHQNQQHASVAEAAPAEQETSA